MIEKLAVLVVLKRDGSQVVETGERGDIYNKARALIREINDGGEHDIFRVVALGEAGTLKAYKWKKNAPAEAVAPAVESAAEDATADDEADASTDAKALRAALKAKGVNVPPRISDEKLIALAIENGVEG